jgi:hypothetical protein
MTTLGHVPESHRADGDRAERVDAGKEMAIDHAD